MAYNISAEVQHCRNESVSSTKGFSKEALPFRQTDRIVDKGHHTEKVTQLDTLKVAKDVAV
jgi:hypothetical protein